MEEILTQEMKDIIASLGKLIKADDRCRAIEEKIDAYEKSEELTSLIGEYNMQQNILADAYSDPAKNTDEFKKTVQARIDELYDKIVSHPVYVDYVGAKSAFDELTQEVYAELQFAVTGTRPCSHDCSSCHGDCGHEH